MYKNCYPKSDQLKSHLSKIYRMRYFWWSKYTTESRKHPKDCLNLQEDISYSNNARMLDLFIAVKALRRHIHWYSPLYQNQSSFCSTWQSCNSAAPLQELGFWQRRKLSCAACNVQLQNTTIKNAIKVFMCRSTDRVLAINIASQLEALKRVSRACLLTPHLNCIFLSIFFA